MKGVSFRDITAHAMKDHFHARARNDDALSGRAKTGTTGRRSIGWCGVARMTKDGNDDPPFFHEVQLR